GESVGEWVGETQVVQGVEETVGFDLTTDQWGTLGGSTAGGIAVAGATHAARGTQAYQWLDSTRMARGVQWGAQGLINGGKNLLWGAGRVGMNLIGTPLMMIGNPEATLNSNEPGTSMSRLKQG
ncbi:hypothetical protein K1X76_12050, partial [bacterium]|nr:hypothetical protein [bacterium]